MKRALLLAGLLWCVPQARAQDSTSNFQYRFGGYYRSLFTASHSYFTGDAYGDSLNRVRLSFDGAWKHMVSVHVDYDNEAHFGNLTGEPDFDLVRQRQDGEYFPLFHAFVNEPHAYWDTSLYRGYLTVRDGPVELTLGRQRIAWGTAHFWSPADAFNPISPLQVEADEREGVDAAQLSLRLPANLRWSVVYAPQNGIDRSTEATRLATNVHNFDVAAFAGRFRQDWMAGGTFAGQWGGAGLRGEVTYTWRANAAESNALRLTFGSDYALNSKLYLVGEYFYNQAQPPGISPGQPPNPSDLFRFTNEIFTLDRHFLSGGARYTITPLFHLESYAVIDAQGPGVFFLPIATYNLSNNADLSAGGQLFATQPGGEFQGVPNLFYLQFTVHF
ncbi:MAG: hypothetical protein ACRD4Y_13995 [Candidatus Acidiferrales bacterium]